MLRVTEPSTSSRAQSMASTSMLNADDANYEEVDLVKLYEAVLKILILEYRNEPRFRTPLKQPSPATTASSTSTTSSNGGRMMILS